MRKELIRIALVYGYLKKDYGYRKISKHYAHWITFFPVGTFQMYAYANDDPAMEKIYDTGVIKLIPETFETLIEIFHINYI